MLVSVKASQVQTSLQRVLADLLKTVGVALFGIAIFNLALDTREWHKYFEERIKAVLVEQSYLKTLDKSILRSLQTNVLKALFGDQDIDREGGFLNYFHANLHKYIAEPYREDVTCEIVCKDDEADSFSVFDRVTYSCRKAGGAIQARVKWEADSGEHLWVESVKIEAQYPATHPKQGERVPLVEVKGLRAQQDGTTLFVADLKDFSNVDGLIVIVTSEYGVSKERFQYWQMAHPTKNLDITLVFPHEYLIQVKPLVITPEQVLLTQQPGYVKMKYDSWMLPQSGLAWRFLPQ